MPPANLRCSCSSESQPLDHWRAGCTLPPQARAWFEGGLQRTLHDERHRDGRVTITRLLTCPRQWIIPDYLKYTYDPLSWHKARVGTLVQEEVARYAETVGAQAEVKVAGRLFGLDVSGSIDLLSGNLINEGKFHAEKRMDAVMGRAKWVKPAGVPQLLGDDYVAQVNMQRILGKQSGIDVDKMIVSHSGMEDPAWPSECAPLRDEEWIGAVRPCGGSFTVRQIAGMVSNFQTTMNEKGWNDPAEVEETIKECVPKVGQSCWVDKSGKSMCDKFCSFKKECDNIG